MDFRGFSCLLLLFDVVVSSVVNIHKCEYSCRIKTQMGWVWSRFVSTSEARPQRTSVIQVAPAPKDVVRVPQI